MWTCVPTCFRFATSGSRCRNRQGLVMRTTKGREGRLVPIHDELRSVLATLARGPDGLVFHGPRGAKLKPDTVRTILLRDVLKPLGDRFPTPEGEIGFVHGTPHSFRHYFCSQAFASEATAAEIRDWLGHKDSGMVEHYRHQWDEQSQRQMKRINFLGTDDCLELSTG